MMNGEAERNLAAFQREVKSCTEIEEVRLAVVTLYRRMVRTDLPDDPVSAALEIVEMFVRDLGRSRQKALDCQERFGN